MHGSACSAQVHDARRDGAHHLVHLGLRVCAIPACGAEVARPPALLQVGRRDLRMEEGGHTLDDVRIRHRAVLPRAAHKDDGAPAGEMNFEIENNLPIWPPFG